MTKPASSVLNLIILSLFPLLGNAVQAQQTSPSKQGISAPRAAGGQKEASPEQPEMKIKNEETTQLGQMMVAVKALPECSLARTNKSCRLTIDRERPLTPPTVQMYSDQSLTVIVKRPKTYERYFLDYQSGQATISPDIASAIVQGMFPSFAKIAFQGFDFVEVKKSTVNECAAREITDPAIPAAGTVKDILPAVKKCLAQLAGKETPIYRALEPFVAPDSRTPNPPVDTGNVTDIEKLKALKQPISEFLTTEFVLSARISSIAGDDKLKKAADDLRTADARAIVELTDLQKSADALAADLLSYSLRIADLEVYQNGFQDCSGVTDLTEEDRKQVPPVMCTWITSKVDDATVYHNMVTRTITYSLNSLNLVSNSQQAAPDPSKKKLLASLAINFADNPKSASSALRWEASAGTFFSSLPIRSFSAAPVFTNGAITDKKVSQNLIYPTVVPFAAGNYRLTNDLGWTRWKSNIYWTGAVGINPNTVSADFATGLSLSWRALMVSGLCHFGHDVRLTQGLTVGESLGAGFNGSPSTQTHWTTKFAVGLSVRVPSLTGR
jgi:hypothetical protein